MNKKYYFADDTFQVEIEKGVMRRINGSRESGQVKYINEKDGFGDIMLSYRKPDTLEKHVYYPLRSEAFEEKVPEKKKRSLSYDGVVSDEAVSVQVSYVLEKGSLTHRITVTNVTDAALELMDFGVRLACMTEFKWGENAGDKVIGHHFVAGHGSHSAFYRCDGERDILLALPIEHTELLYYETDDDGVGDAQKKRGVTWLYSLNMGVSEKAAEAGSRFRIPPKSKRLEAGESCSFAYRYVLAGGYEDCKQKLMENGKVVAESVPGYTVPRELEVTLCIRKTGEEAELCCDDKKAELTFIRREGDRSFYSVKFHRLGETCITVHYGNEEYVQLYYFVTEPIETMLKKRAAFIVSKQHRDTSKWYDGLFGEWNNETGVLLGPDNYDKIGGWRIYEVSCDDPGLSKPAFLSSKLAEYPVQEEIDALEYYVEHFVWGGLQRTEEESFSYGIYGIPDWHVLRNNGKKGTDGEMHIWRIYDYPHIALMYYNLYRIATEHDGIRMKLSGREYLHRAYRTALALFTIPEELEGWSAYKTGLYNELCIPNIIKALQKEGMEEAAVRLERHWVRKANYFAMECTDIFGSEYPFDTTGFESTYVLAETALEKAVLEKTDDPFFSGITYGKAVEMLEKQQHCNIACRGVLEPAYFWYGSDYRGDNMHYMLSYMSQMGGYSLLNYALYHAPKPFDLLRLAYGSVLSSYALMNTGDEESGYGYWFKGKEHDGAAGGGFEPKYLGETWLDQPHKGGSWYYSCEIDLGFCGGIRSAAAVLAEDPVFGRICYGGAYETDMDSVRIDLKDGIRKQFHYVGDEEKRLHVCFEKGRLSACGGVRLSDDLTEMVLTVDEACTADEVKCTLMPEHFGTWSCKELGVICEAGVKTELCFDKTVKTIHFVRI